MNFQIQPREIVRPRRLRNLLISFFCATALVSSVFALKFPTTHFVSAIAARDVNDDGFDDIVSCGANNRNSVDVLLGNGDGTFQKAKSPSVGRGPGAIALGDFDLDGSLDVATANFGIDDDFNNTISVLLGNGDGTFQQRHDFVVGGTPNSIVTTDLNGDGLLDFVVGESSRFAILLGIGAGRYHLSSAIDLPDDSDSIALGDIDGDGITDVFAGNAVEGNSICLGNGDGTFRPPIQRVGEQLHPLLVDLNGDGLSDLIAIPALFRNNWNVYLNLGNENFSFIFDQGFGSFDSVDDFAPGDFNNDGKIDFAITVKDTQTGNQGLYIELGNGDGTFQLLNSRVSAGDVIAAGFFNSDSAVDLAGGDSQSLFVMTVYGQGDGTFVTRPRLPQK